MTENEFIEVLADKEHASWSHWMEYLFDVCKRNEDGSVTIPPDLAKRWRGQAKTPYADLTEKEKQSDRDEVHKIMPIIIKEFFHDRTH